MLHTTESVEARRALLAKYLRGGLSQETKETIPSYSSGRPAPLSFGQQQLWLLDQLMPDEPVYNECVTIHLPGPLAIAVFERSFNEIIRRHEAWRTSFPLVDGQPVQMVHPPAPIALPVVDLLSLPASEREAEALRLAAKDARILFDMAQGPLLRAKLIRLGEQEHRLFLTLHHIIFDGVAIYQVFLPELRTIYEAFLAGQPSPLPPAPVKYTDYAWWQREWLEKEVFADQMVYWHRQLTGAAVLELPTDRPRPAVQTYRGSMFPFALSNELTNALKTLAGQEGATLYMILVAAFKTLLYRYTGQEDMLVGTATASRNRAQLQRLMGFCLSTVVLRTNLSGNPTFRELLKRVREVVAMACAHDDVPFEYVVKELHPDRSLDHNPLFQVLITLVPPRPVLASGWTLRQMDVKNGTSKFDLSLELDNRPEGLIGRFEFNTDLFDESTISRMAEHWQTLLEGIVNNPDQRLSTLPLLTIAERQQLLIDWNATAVTYPRDQCVHQLFEAQVEQTPEAVAVVFEEQQMTYRELNSKANQLAHYLKRLGVGSEVLVGLCMDRSLEMVVGLLGILKAGGAYVPLDPSYPKDRLAFMLQDAQVAVLLTQEKFVDLFLGQETQVICLDTRWQTITQEYAENPVSKLTAEKLAYVMYTSGSTGRPKGVEVMHRSIIRLLFGVDYVCLDATQTLLHMAPISFDAATFEVWGALLHGARCILFPERIPTPKSIGAAIREHNVTTAWLTASLFNAVIDETPDALIGLKQLLTGGEALSVAHICRALDLLPTTQIINGYGPTESTTFTCCYPIPRQLSDTTRSVPIGTPIGNTQVYILDHHLNPVPVGVPGELYIGGAGLARGYRNRPELTAEKFIISPFDADLSLRLYKTGDQARYLPDGNIEFLGRFDHQVKIRGFRIELGEIEVVLSQHTGVREVVVSTHEVERNEKRIVTYVVPRHGQSLMLNELRSFLKERLPDYMMPSSFVLLEALPLMPNGKIDRRALLAPDPSRATAEETYVAPTHMLHHQLIAIWEELLNVRPIGIRDNFFYLGGHSLLAVHLVERIERIFHQKLQLATLFAGPTIEQLATALQGPVESDSQLPIKAIQIQAGKAKRPFFFLHGNWRGDGFYCYPLARALGKEQPFYALPPYPLDGLQIPPTLEEMAAAYVTSLRMEQPEGPYMLGGWCNGALVTYEMARQLHMQGQKVAMLILVHPADLVPSVRIRWARNAICRLGSLLHLSPEKQLDLFLRACHISNYLRYADYQQRVEFKRLKAASLAKWAYRGNRGGRLLSHLEILFPAIELLRTYEPIFAWIVSRYTPSSSYTGKITFLWHGGEPCDEAAWRQVIEASEAQVYALPGTHETLLTEHLSEVAEQIRSCIESVQKELVLLSS